MKIGYIILLGIVFILLILGLSLGFGWFGVYQTKTVGKAQQNVNREVFEQTQSYVEGKRQELIKYHHEWMKASSEDKITIESTIRMSFANFDDNKLKDFSELYNFLETIKNK